MTLRGLLGPQARRLDARAATERSSPRLRHSSESLRSRRFSSSASRCPSYRDISCRESIRAVRVRLTLNAEESAPSAGEMASRKLSSEAGLKW